MGLSASTSCIDKTVIKLIREQPKALLLAAFLQREDTRQSFNLILQEAEASRVTSIIENRSDSYVAVFTVTGNKPITIEIDATKLRITKGLVLLSVNVKIDKAIAELREMQAKQLISYLMRNDVRRKILDTVKQYNPSEVTAQVVSIDKVEVYLDRTVIECTVNRLLVYTL
jgi:hypothetical protein